MLRCPLVIRDLLGLSFLLAVSRALVSPLLVLTLSRQLQLAAQEIGWLLGAVVLLATVSGLYAGFLVDRFDRRRLLQLALLLIAAGFVLLPFSRAVLLAGLALLLLELAFALLGIAIKALLSDLLPPDARSRVFSLRYTLTNVGFALGPFIGSVLAQRQLAWVFWLAAALALGCWPLLRRVPRSVPVRAVAVLRFGETLALLRRDRALVLFTLGSLLACVVHGRFSDYLALYLLQSHGDAEVLRWMSALIACNALTVVLLQYPLGRLLRPQTLVRWIVLSSLLLAAALAGFALSGSLWAWCAWMVVFTLGEIILIPAEYLYVDAMAPEALKGSYYGAQNLANLGNAVSPALSGMMLTLWPGAGLLLTMMWLTLGGALLVWLAERQRVPVGAAAVAVRG